MLKFQDNNTTVIATFKDFIFDFTLLLTGVSSVCTQYYQPNNISWMQKLSDSRRKLLLSVSVELAGVDFGNAWFSL